MADAADPDPSGRRDYAALRTEQEALAARVRIEDDLPETVRVVAGFDAAYRKGGPGEPDEAFGALVLADATADDPAKATLDEPLAVRTTQVPVDVPYIPGLLAYREVPVLEALWARLDRTERDRIDLLLVDGGGLIHPRRVGSASHAGLVLDLPTVGVTKSLLLGEVDGPLEAVGDAAPVRDGDELLGYAFRSSPRATRPIYVSPGHRVTATTALAWVRRLCSGRQKLPDVVWAAHKAAGQAKDRAVDRGR